MRGDRPSGNARTASSTAFTPHARGSTLMRTMAGLCFLVYPACAGIDPMHHIGGEDYICLPRMRGDRPLRPRCIWDWMKFTPHARGSTVGHLGRLLSPMVYPACAGIDRGHCQRQALSLCLPRMRGDRPSLGLPSATSNRFTPHARGSTSSSA